MSSRTSTNRLFLFLTSLPSWLTYCSSFVVVGFSTWLLLGLQHFVARFDGIKHGPAFIAFYFVAIALATVMGGLRAGLFAVLLSLFSTAYFLIPPHGLKVLPTMTNYVTLGIVVIVGALVALGMDAYRNSTTLLMENMNLLTTEQARADQEAVLNKIGQAVRNAGHPDEVQAVAVESLGQMLNADACHFISFNLTRDTATIGQYWRRDGEEENHRTFRLSDLNVDPVSFYTYGKTIAISDTLASDSLKNINSALNKYGVRAAIIVPLTANGQLESTLVVSMSREPREWQHSEIALVETVASQTRSAVDAARLQQKEHNIAIQLQAALQPELSIDVPGLSISSFYRAALDEANVGGDFYDAFQIGRNRIVFVVGDVSGKGLAAASQVAAIRHMLRCLMQTNDNIEDAIDQLNNVLIAQNLLPSFATLFVGVFDQVAMTLDYVSCGHEPALVYRFGTGGTVEHLEATGPVIGVFDKAFGGPNARIFQCSRRQLVAGDALLLYTDGVCDAGADTSHLLGVEGIVTQLTGYFVDIEQSKADDARWDASRLLQYSMSSTEQFAHGILRDDICLLSVIVSPEYRAEQFAYEDSPITTMSDSDVAPATSSLEKEFGGGAVTAADIEALRKSMLADVLKLATRGKLRIVTSLEYLPQLLTNRAEPVSLQIGENVRRLRRAVRSAASVASLAENFSDSLEMAAGEAANNSLVHGADGVGYVSWEDDGQVQVRIEDTGKGIPFEDLPRATLERGYTTAGTLGQGFWIILQSVKRCWIVTGNTGTVVVLEQDNEEAPLHAIPDSALI